MKLSERRNLLRPQTAKMAVLLSCPPGKCPRPPMLRCAISLRFIKPHTHKFMLLCMVLKCAGMTMKW